MNWLMLLSVVISILVVSAVFLFIQSQVERMGSKNDENDEKNDDECCSKKCNCDKEDN